MKKKSNFFSTNKMLKRILKNDLKNDFKKKVEKTNQQYTGWLIFLLFLEHKQNGHQIRMVFVITFVLLIKDFFRAFLILKKMNNYL